MGLNIYHSPLLFHQNYRGFERKKKNDVIDLDLCCSDLWCYAMARPKQNFMPGLLQVILHCLP